MRQNVFPFVLVAALCILAPLCNTGYAQGVSSNLPKFSLVRAKQSAVSKNPPTLLSARAKPIGIELAYRVLGARAPKSRPTALRASQISKQKSPKVSRQGIKSFASLTPIVCSGTGQPVEIAALAASLKCDPDLIFEYVYNNIEYEPLFGSNKGALGTLLDLRGDDADQAQLFVALLRAAGFSAAQVNFVTGYVHLTGAQASSWLGVKNDGNAILQLLANGGIPLGTYSVNTDQTLNYVNVAQWWVRVNIGGTNYDFDPSFKLHTVKIGLSNLTSALGYSQGQFLADAGGAIDSVGISNINRTAARNDLAKYANNLISYIKNNNPAWSMGDVVGGKDIQYLVGSPLRQTTLPILTTPQPAGFPLVLSAIPNSVRTCFTISMPGVTSQDCAHAGAQNILLYSDQTYGHRITVFSTGGSCAPPSGSCTPTLLIDGAAPPNGQNTGTAQNYGDTTHPWPIVVSITHPTASFVNPNETATLSVISGGSYLIGAGWGQVGRGMVEKHRTLLAQAQAAGGSATSEGVLGESLAVISYTYLAQVADQQRLGDAVAKVSTQYFHGLGIIAQASVQGSGNQGPYVDLPLNFTMLQPQTFYTGSGIAPSILSTFYAGAGVLSALESAVLEQTQGLVPGMQAASTVRLVDANAASGAETYFADGTTSAGLSAYFSSIRPNLTGYSASDLSSIDNAISSNGLSTGSPKGFQVLVPLNGNIAIGTVPWRGAGYSISQSDNTTGVFSMAQKISGGLSGGFSGNNIPTPTVVSSTRTLTQPPSVTPSIPSGAIAQPYATNHFTASEPVDAITGAYLYDHADLAIGSGAFPYGLSLSRRYSSAANMADSGLGNGWKHNFDISVLRTSDPYVSLGERSPIDAAAAIAAIFVTQDLLTGSLSAQHMTLAWIADRWLTDQLTNNAVLVLLPNTSEEYAWLPHNDGASTFAYSPPLGSAVSLTGSAPDTYGNPTTFVYRNKDQSQLSFYAVNSSLVGQINSWTMPYGVNLSFSYGYTYNGNTYLTSVSNNLGRTLSLSYSGAHLAGVSDGTGRSVAYGYDGSNNLTSFKDPLGFQTSFGYDGSAGHLTQIFYPSSPFNAFVTNAYDGLGKVNQQANANGNATAFYLAGSRSELIDPAGDRHITYQTVRGNVLKDDWVLSGTSNVFNDTVQNNGAVNVTSKQYDGQDRLTLVTLAEGGTSAYTYSPDLLQNLIQVINTPKPASPLSPTTTTYTYDPIYNKQSSVTDPRGLISTSSYDAATGNLLNTTADAGASHFNAVSQFTYNSVGQVLTATDPLGVVTKFTYDGFGNPSSTTRDFGNGRLNQLTTMIYNLVGDVVSITDPNGNPTSNAYDADRRRISTTAPSAPSSPGGLLTTFTYDPDGHLLQTQQSLGGTVLRTTSSTYSLTGEIATSSDAKGNVTKYGYDVVDRLVSTTDPVSNVTTYSYDALSRQTSVANAAIQVAPLLQKAYTPDGLLASLTDANNHATNFTYDGLDRLSATTYPDSPSDKETLAYDADSNIVSRVTRRGDTISFSYDTLNRLCTKAIAASPTPCGISSANPTSFYSYDLVGHSIAVNDNSASIVAPSGTGASYTTSASYDALNNPITTSWNPAAAQSTPTASSVTFSHGYDANNRRITQAANDNSWWNYPSTPGTTSYTANTLNQYSAVGVVSPTYDGNGNLASDGTYVYCYDAESRLTVILSSGTCASPVTTVASYAYDGQGRRKSKTAGGTTTLFVTDADNREVLEYNGSGAVQNWYSYGQGSNEVLSQMNGAGSARATLIPDIQGSIIGALGSSGTLTKIGYQTYGENPNLVSGAFNYTAQRFDAETAGSAFQPSGLYYYRARMYSPTWGRFMQPDPVGYAGGVNLYAYTDNDPLNQTDPSGNCPACIGAIGGTIVGLAGQGISDLYRGNSFRWQNYAGAAAGGAVGGALLFTSLNPAAAGAAAGATQNTTTQLLNIATGQQQNFDYKSLAVQTGVGAITGKVLNVAADANAFPGLTNGFTSLSRQMTTKLENGTISTMLPSTAAKTFAGAANEWAPGALAAPATDAASETVTHLLK